MSNLYTRTRPVLKRILSYFVWTLISFLFASGYMLILLWPIPEPSTGFMKIFDWFLVYGFVYVVSIIGSIIALLYILLDVFYLNKRLKGMANSTIIRLLIVVVITVVVGVIHYLLEKVIDVI